MILAISAIAAAAAGLIYVGYRFGARAKAEAVAYEQALKQLYAKAHAEFSVKLAAVKAEIAKLEAEAKAEEQAVVARIKRLL